MRKSIDKCCSIINLLSFLQCNTVALVLVCRNCYCRQMDLITMQHKDNSPDTQLIHSMETVPPAPDPNTVEMDDIEFTSPKLEEILQDENYIEDATGLVPHCLAILKICHELTNKLVAMAMGSSQQIHMQESMTDLIAMAKRITPRVDEVVRSMYPPLDPRLLEARCTALVLSVNHLVYVVKNAYRLAGTLDWADQSLADVEDHLRVLKEASIAYDINCRILPNNSTTMDNQQQATVTIRDESSQV
ncbi:Transmembrane protein 98 [Acanthosepion pharaonis]|uniref:Transmembrane protein 98 n=1 Tax=Acanthosepion pharaonis TaxID=158019 RepID=A0A812DSC9_ACAPH|nr:Transmembrane protein 98 [Sepia pharaonis]